MRIGEHHLPLRFRTNGVAARLSPRDKKLLLGSEAINIRRAGLAFHGFEEGHVSQLDAAQIADALAQHQPAIVLQAALYFVSIELLGYAGAAAFEFLVVG